MLIARLKPTTHAGRRYLSGVMQNVDAIDNGQMIVLRKIDGGEYHVPATTESTLSLPPPHPAQTTHSFPIHCLPS